MPKPKIIDNGPCIGLSDLEKIEQVLGARLPSAYRRFMLKHNGGCPVPEFFPNNSVSAFYSIRHNNKSQDFVANYRRMRKWLPDDLVPIADDDFGNEICLAIQGKNRGKVYFWEHEGGTEKMDVRAMFPEIQFKPYEEGEPRPRIKDDWPGHPDLTLIASSFTEFLESFHDEPELDDEPEEEAPEPEPEPARPSKAAKPTLAEPALWDLPAKPRKAQGGSKSSKTKGGSKSSKAKPPAKKGTRARPRDKK